MAVMINVYWRRIYSPQKIWPAINRPIITPTGNNHRGSQEITSINHLLAIPRGTKEYSVFNNSEFRCKQKSSFLGQSLLRNKRTFSRIDTDTRSEGKPETAGENNNRPEEKEEKEVKKSKKTFSDLLDDVTKPLIFTLLTVATLSWLAADRSDEGQTVEKPDHGGGFQGFVNACIYNIKTNFSRLLTFDTYEETLLPDELPYPYSKPLSLLIELDELLATLKWDKSIGWRIYTRPGMKEFLITLGRYYEMILYVNAPAYVGEPVCQTLDPQFYFFTYRLYRDHMIYKNNRYIKDLSKVNRNLSKVIAVDVDEDSVQMNNENSVIVKKWNGDNGDKALKDIEKFLVELYILYSFRGEKDDIRNILSDVKSIKAPSIVEAWSIYKDRLREDYDRKVREYSNKKSFLFNKNIIRNNSRKGKNIVDIIESVAKDEKKACLKESQSNLENMIEYQKKRDEMVRKYIQDSLDKRLKLWDYLFGDTMPFMQDLERSPPNLENKSISQTQN